jgi:hypothetical protein
MTDPIRIRYKGEFDYDTLYSTIQSFIANNRYTYHEGKFKQKSGEAEIKLKGESKATDYFRYNIEVWIKIFNGHFPAKGKAKGDVDLQISGEIDEDYQGIYKSKKSPFWKIIKKMIDFLLDKEKDEVHEGYLEDEMKELQGKIQKLFHIER